MKAFQNILRFRYLLIPVTFFYMVTMESCTKKFEQLNTDPTSFSSLPAAAIPKALARCEYEGVYGDAGGYELLHSLFTDLWSQYFADAGGTPTDRYAINQDWIISSWNLMYTINWPSLKLVIDATEGTSPAANAIAKIWKVYMFHQTSDIYGPIPYFQAGLGTLSIPYDSQESIYMDFFKTLDSANTALKAADATQTPFGTDDMIYHGDIVKWMKFGNSLRLRLALRISEIDPQMAQQQAEAAVANGVMMDTDDDAFVDVTSNPNSSNGLCDEAPWQNMRMSATMESYLKGYNDPRMQQYYSPADQDGQYHGLRNGMPPTDVSNAVVVGGQFQGAVNLSNINLDRWNPLTDGSTKLNVMYAAESYFLKAEAALNGWNMGGNAIDFYNQGIALSMQQWGITDNVAIQNYITGTSTPAALSDYLNSPAVSNIPVKFATDPAIERQQVLTQKWLAIFPDGIEAWAEVRRTGFPVLYPILHSDNPDVNTSDIIRRIPFLDYEKATNGTAVQAALSLLSGPDKASTHVWWNK